MTMDERMKKRIFMDRYRRISGGAEEGEGSYV